MTPYPFGSDGNPVDPSSTLCDGANQYGPSWGNGAGDFNSSPGTTGNNPPCYLQVNSFAFRAWNRGLAAVGLPYSFTGTPPTTVAFGVWLFNGTNWFPDPAFPGSNVCAGSTIMWAGKLDYWLVGSSTAPQRTLCRFDGVNLEWEPISLPSATVARLPLDANGNPAGGVTSGACYAWNNCWFFGDDGVEVHWDGQSLSDASRGSGTSPWEEGDATGAVSGTDASGQPFGLEVAKSSRMGPGGTTVPSPAAPDGSAPPQLFGSQGGPWAPLPYSPPGTPAPGDPFTTDLSAVGADVQGDAWIAGDPAPRLAQEGVGSAQPAPLVRLSESGAPVSCSGYGSNTFTSQPGGANGNSVVGYTWHGLSTFPDSSAAAAASYANTAYQWSASSGGRTYPVGSDQEPGIVHAACGQSPTITEFRRPDPLDSDQAHARLIPADYAGWVTATAADASNDAWSATTAGTWGYFDNNGNHFFGNLAPHLYHFTDGLTPSATAGDDNETRPSLFTLDPPVYQVTPTVVVTPVTTTTTRRRAKSRRIRLKPAIYALRTRVHHEANGSLTLALTFKVRRTVTIGLEALHGHTIVATTGLRRFSGHTGRLSLTLDRAHWPTGLRLVTPKRRSRKG